MKIDKYCETLELHKILSMLSDIATNDATKQLISSLKPKSDLDEVKKELSYTDEAFKLSVKLGTPSFYSFKDIRGTVKRAESSASLSLRELLDIGTMLRQIRVLDDYRKECEEESTALDFLFTALLPQKWLEDKIANTILSEDEIADTASSELASIRRKIARAGMRIRESLDKMIHSSDMQKALQENIVTMRDGRYVIPVKSEHKGAVRGIVHATSSTGSTLFIEPEAVVEANNDIRVLKGLEQEEIERIIAQLSSDVASISEAILSGYDICAELCLYFAKSTLGTKMKASIPIVSDDGIIELKKARHPLIDPARVIPIDVTLGESYNTLIVTGPNTGGKTVLLKTCGLLSAMAMCGMMIPAGDGSRISVFDKILVDIGDMQSIENNLSTFSSHMSNVVGILAKADERSLILIDELGSGTDPIEGAALAIATIKAMAQKGAKIIVTTHYQELKVFALEEDKTENASCEFDVKTMQPTYRLIIGSPGKSNAFSITARLGMPKDVINEAKELVSDENRHFEDVIAQLEASRKALDRKTSELEQLRREQDELKASLIKEKEQFELSKDAEFEKARLSAMKIVENCRIESDKLLDELALIRKEKNNANFENMAISAKSQSKSALNKMYNEANPVKKVDNAPYKPPRPFKRGDTVMIVDLNKKGILAGDPDNSGNVFVQLGNMKTKTNTSRLRLVEGEKPTQQQQKKSPAVTRKNTSKVERRSSLELDIRGYDVLSGISEVDAFLDNAVICHAGIITIIHGKGTGLLREGIQRHLKGHPLVKSYRNGLFGEGEEGVTVVELK